MGNPYLKEELEGFDNAKDDAGNWLTAFGITIGVSSFNTRRKLNIYYLVECRLHAWMLFLYEMRLL